MRVELLEYPGERDWIEVYRRALVTVGKDTVKNPLGRGEKENSCGAAFADTVFKILFFDRTAVLGKRPPLPPYSRSTVC